MGDLRKAIEAAIEWRDSPTRGLPIDEICDLIAAAEAAERALQVAQRENERLCHSLEICRNLTHNQEKSPGTVRQVGIRVAQIVNAALSEARATRGQTMASGSGGPGAGNHPGAASSDTAFAKPAQPPATLSQPTPQPSASKAQQPDAAGLYHDRIHREQGGVRPGVTARYACLAPCPANPSHHCERAFSHTGRHECADGWKWSTDYPRAAEGAGACEYGNGCIHADDLFKVAELIAGKPIVLPTTMPGAQALSAVRGLQEKLRAAEAELERTVAVLADARQLRDEAEAERDELRDDKKRALRRAYERSLECQTVDEAVADLIRQIDEARTRAEAAESALEQARARLKAWEPVMRLAYEWCAANFQPYTHAEFERRLRKMAAEVDALEPEHNPSKLPAEHRPAPAAKGEAIR
jgi:hypothetical protein